MSSVTLSAATVAAGSTEQGAINLTSAAPAGGASVTLASSNPAVATVQTPVMVQAGSTVATIAVTAVAAGTATITASLNGSIRQSPMLTVIPRPAVALASISLSAASVVGGDTVTGRVTLNTAAPAGGAVVALSANDPIGVPASVTVPAELTTATFPVTTRVVSSAASATITGSYGGASASAPLLLTPPTVATARFGVRGPTETETCTLTNDGNTLTCTFDGSTSTAPGRITAWDWSYGAAKTFTQTTSGPVMTNPTVDCSLIPPPPFPDERTWFTMAVRLTVHDSLGNVSAEAVNNDVRLIPKGVCGF